MKKQKRTHMVESPGSVRTISAAPRAASVAPSTAIPTLARERAGASLAPSPVMALMEETKTGSARVHRERDEEEKRKRTKGDRDPESS
jgi:hypothetical protein